MSQQVKISRDLVFQEYANQTANIKGNPMYEKVFLHDHFNVDADESDWIETTQGATIANSAGLGGRTTITTDASDNGCGEITHAVNWSPAKNCVMEARIKVDIITLVGINVGWVDARHNTDNQINFELTAGAATLVDVRVTDGAAFVFDTDGTPDVWYCAGVDSDSEGVPVAALGSLAPVADTYANLRVALDTLGNATFYYNGNAVGYLPTCCSPASTDLYTPYVAVIERSASARVLTIDRITCWQDE